MNMFTLSKITRVVAAVAAFAVVACVASGPAAFAQATWDGGGANGSWATAENWVGDATPTFNNTLDLTFNAAGAGNLSNWLGASRTIRSLTFNDDADNTIGVSFTNNGSIGAQDLTMGNATDGATITVASGAAGDITLGSGGNGRSILLAADLVIDHAGSGTLTTRNISGSFGVTKNGTGTWSTRADKGVNDFTGGLTVNDGTVNLLGTIQFAGGLSIAGGSVNLSAGTADFSGGVTVTGGTLSVTTAPTYTGDTSITNGVVQVSVDAALSSGTLTLGSGAVLGTDSTRRTLANSVVITGDVQLGETGSRLTLSGPIDLGSSTRTLTVENSPTNGNLATILSGVISGNAGIIKEGTGILEVTNADNSFTGDVSLVEGTLLLSSNVMGNAANKLLVNGDGSVVVSNIGVQALTISNAVDVAANFTFGGGGSNTLTLGGAMDLGGATRTITLNGAATKALDGVISNGGLALVVDDGTVTLGGANTFSGGTTVNGTVGLVNLTNSLALQNSTLAYATAGGSVAFDGITEATFGGLSGDKALALANTAAAAVALSVGNNDASTAYSGELSGAGSLTKVGSGTLTLSGGNSYAGATTISAGTLLLSGGADRLPTTTAVTIADAAGAVLDLGGQNQTIASLASAGVTGGGGVALGAGTLTVNGAADGIFAGVISGAGGLVKDGTGDLALGNASTYAGPTTVTDGQLIIANAASLGSTAAGTSVSGTGQLRLSPVTAGITVAAEPLSLAGAGPGGNGTLRNFSGTNIWQGPITLTAASTIGAANGSQLTIDVASGSAITAADFDLSFTGGGTSEVVDAISLGTGGITKLGNGTAILRGANVYAGATTVSDGTLLINGNQSASGGAVTVESGGTLGGSGTIGGAVSILAGGIVSPGTSPGTLTLSTTTFSLADTSILNFELNPADTTAGGGINDLITGVTDLTLAGTLNISGTGDWATVAEDTTWRLFDYTGTLSGAGLTLGTTPTLAPGLSFAVDTATAGEVNITVVPEPLAMLLAVGTVALAAWRLRRRGA